MLDYGQQLQQGIEALCLPVSLSEQQFESLLHYHQLLIKWNAAYNLTAVRDPVLMISRHLLDSLSLVPFIAQAGELFIDVGTGAGLPGLVLAIVLPQQQFHLLDSNGKKTRFLFQVKTELQLNNLTVYHSRIEQHQFAPGYDGILSRAFATLSDMVQGSQHLLKSSGCFYAMKGQYPADEIQQLSALKKPYIVSACHSLTVPGEDAARHLVVIKSGNHQH